MQIAVGSENYEEAAILKEKIKRLLEPKANYEI
jgi:protein-arginine kinase activator protein McsA